MRTAPILSLALLALACSPARLHPSALCAEMSLRCGGGHPENWEDWCNSDCVPDVAREVRCAANDECLLCAPDDPEAGLEGETIEVFGFPSDDIEFLWTQLLPRDAVESVHPATEPAPTGDAFDDRTWDASAEGVGSWRALQPVDAGLGDPDAYFCEPGPNLYLRSNVSGGSALEMHALSLPSENAALACPAPFCASGPYAACDSVEPRLCPYGDEPELVGYGTSSQVDRMLAPGSSEEASYGYGRYRATFRAGGPTTGPVSGTVYAFFSQSNVPCADGAPNDQTNTAEIDIELSASDEASSGGLPFCDASQMCFIVSTWTSSYQGLPRGVGGERHQVSGFRFRDRETAGELRTYGYDWREHDVRFTYDVAPGDCDEAAGGCDAAHGSVAICEHTHFVPRRPSPLHFQLWNSWWGGDNAPGTPSEMTVTEVWHVPQ